MGVFECLNLVFSGGSLSQVDSAYLLPWALVRVTIGQGEGSRSLARTLQSHMDLLDPSALSSGLGL